MYDKNAEFRKDNTERLVVERVKHDQIIILS